MMGIDPAQESPLHDLGNLISENRRNIYESNQLKQASNT